LTAIILKYSDGWVSIDTVTPIDVGTAFFVQNDGRHAALASESTTMPLDDSSVFKIHPDPELVLSVPENSGKLWVKNNSGLNVISLTVLPLVYTGVELAETVYTLLGFSDGSIIRFSDGSTIAFTE
jgi:hypothetical protein